MGFIEELVDELREVFSIDKDFSEKKFEKQMAVVRGQALNLASAMRFGPIKAQYLPLKIAKYDPVHIRNQLVKLVRIGFEG